MLETIAFWIGFGIGSAAQASGVNRKVGNYLLDAKGKLFEDMPTDTGDKWLDEQNAKLNKIKMIRTRKD